MSARILLIVLISVPPSMPLFINTYSHFDSLWEHQRNLLQVDHSSMIVQVEMQVYTISYLVRLLRVAHLGSSELIQCAPSFILPSGIAGQN